MPRIAKDDYVHWSISLDGVGKSNQVYPRRIRIILGITFVDVRCNYFRYLSVIISDGSVLKAIIRD